VVQANGLSALYRTNGTSWTMNTSGLVVSSDLLFWGAVGGTGAFWFPVAPGVTTLPTTPAVVDGQMTVGVVVPPANERVDLAPRVRSVLQLTSFDYSLDDLSVLALPTRSTVTVVAFIAIAVPAADVSVTAAAPVVAIGGGVEIPAGTVTVTALVPVVAASAVVDVPAADVTVVAELPGVQAGDTLVPIPAADVVVVGVTPTISVGSGGAAGGDGAVFWADWAYREDDALLYAEEQASQASAQALWKLLAWLEDGAALLGDE
jgi:hypothetical protein